MPTQLERRRRHGTLAFVVGALAFVASAAGPAFAEPARCRREIARASAKLVQARFQAIQKCEDRALVAGGGTTCPDAKAAATLAKATGKLQAAIARACGGGDGACGTGDDDSLASVGWNLGSCPNVDCGAPIAHCGDVGTCLTCAGDAAVDITIDGLYAAYQSGAAGDVLACQRALGRETAKLARLRSKVLATCEAGVLAGKAAGPCPTAKAAGTLANATAKARAKSCQRCGGDDGTCGTPDDLTAAAVGAPATCPAVTVPGGDACGAAIADVGDLVECAICVTTSTTTCVDALAVPAIVTYPPACGGGGGPTPTPGGPTPSPTPGAGCGNGTVDPGEQCDGTDDAVCPNMCTSGCVCASSGCELPSPLPEIVSIISLAGSDSDNGWTGIAHDAPAIDDSLQASVRLINCDLNTASPTCGQCDVEGPVKFPGSGGNCACINPPDLDASTYARCDPEAPASCGGGETCQCFRGGPLALSAGAIPSCIVNRYVTPITGTINISTAGPRAGESAMSFALAAVVHNGLAIDRPCPTCEGDPTPEDGDLGGTCVRGPREGMPCDENGSTAFFGPVSIDCPPAAGASIGNLAIALNPGTTGVATLATGPKCTAPGHTASDCFCDTCMTATAEPCNADADCPGGATCGGRRCLGGPNVGMPCSANPDCGAGFFCGRPGQPTAPNACADAVCSPNADDVADEGVCSAGPADSRCNIETFRGCTSDADCTPPPAGSCIGCAPEQICITTSRECFLDPIVRRGEPGTTFAKIVAAYCIAPVSSSAVNQASGLPGAGGLRLPTRNIRSGAQCGNGVLNAGEDCDGPVDDACPDLCEADCTCPICGDDAVNQPAEQCDGPDSAACPGACQPNCTCGAATCGNGEIEFGEDCDGAATGACVGPCAGDCSCAPVCADGIVNGADECDGAASTACPPAACLGNCTCGPYCGDGTVNGSEECDGTGVGVCPGTCADDCSCAPVCGDDTRQAGELCDGTDDSLCPGDCTSICTCPGQGEVTFTVTPGADLDAGWTGIVNDVQLQTGSVIRGELSGCDGVADNDCEFFGNIGSFCSADPSRSCTSNDQCTGAGSCILQMFGAPLPVSAGGVPACVVNRFATDATGHVNLATGHADLTLTLSAAAHLGISINEPCPICDCGKADYQDCEIGEAGTCSGIIGSPPCTVEGTGPLGPTSNDCPPSASLNVTGSGLVITFDPITTGTVTFPSSQPCDGSGFQGESCWCDGQTQPNACLSACDGGSNDAAACDTDANCPGGSCTPLCRQIAGEPTGEGECVAGPIDQTCSGAPQISCTSDGGCPSGTGTCVAFNRRCFMDPIVRAGTPGTSTNTLAAAFCVPPTGGTAINDTAGLPGPGAIRFTNDVAVRRCGDGVINRPSEECDGASDANCPGDCQPNCSCSRTCGNNVVEFSEQCDGTSDAACDGQCAAPGATGECMCPPVCGDGFVGAGEQCDPGGGGGSPPASDTACPGQCLPSSCQCPLPPLPSCGNNTLDAGEACDLPAIGCGPLQVCALCTQCLPPPDVVPPELGFICGNSVVEPTEICDIPSIGCPTGQLCNPVTCDECIPVTNSPICGNLSIEAPEVCELPSFGCPAGNTCLLCNQCIPTLPICGNLLIEPGEACELPARGCGLIQACLLCTQCVP